MPSIPSLKKLFFLTHVFLSVLFSSSIVFAKEKSIKIDYGSPKKTVVLTVITPKNKDEKELSVIFTLPPGPGTKKMVRMSLRAYWKREANKRGYIIVTPTIIGPSLRTEAPDLIPAIFKWMDANLKYDKKKVYLSGGSNGGVGAFITAVAFPEKFSKIIVMPGVYLGKLKDLKVLKSKPIWMIAGALDKQWVKKSKETQRALL